MYMTNYIHTPPSTYIFPRHAISYPYIIILIVPSPKSVLSQHTDLQLSPTCLVIVCSLYNTLPNVAPQLSITHLNRPDSTQI